MRRAPTMPHGALVAPGPGRRGRDLYPVHGARTTCPFIPFLPRDTDRIRASRGRWSGLYQVLQLPDLSGDSSAPRRGAAVFMDHALEILPADYWRWWLLSHAPGNRRQRVHLGELPAIREQGPGRHAGQFVSRITKFCRAKFGEAVPEGPAWGPAEQALIEALTAARAAPTRHNMAGDGGPQPPPSCAPSGCRATNTCSPSALDGLQDRPRPGRAMQVPGPEPDPPLRGPVAALHPLRIPGRDAAGDGRADAGWPDDVAQALQALAPGHAFTVPEVMFAKISDEDREAWAARFQGVRA